MPTRPSVSRRECVLLSWVSWLFALWAWIPAFVLTALRRDDAFATLRAQLLVSVPLALWPVLLIPLLAEYRAGVAGTSSLVALWERLRMRSATLIPEWANLVSLRGFTSERNIMTTRLLYELHLRIDPKLRMPGTSRVVQGALALASRRLVWLPDSSTWLPAALPRSMHRSAAAVRRFLSRQRTAVLALRRSRSY